MSKFKKAPKPRGAAWRELSLEFQPGQRMTIVFPRDGKPGSLEMPDLSAPGDVLRYELVPIGEPPCAE